MKAAAIIVAGGDGKRFGSQTSKQFLTLCGKPVFMHSIEAFLSVKAFNQIILAVPKYLSDVLSKKYKNYDFTITAGGKERFDSVKNSMAFLKGAIEFVAVHDAVRPLICAEDIILVLKAAKKYGAAIAAEKAKDTIKISENGFVKSTLDRNILWNAQTPQIFKAALFKKIYSGKIPKDVTDDSMLAEKAGHKIAIVETRSPNFKITIKQDFLFAKQLLSSRCRR
ncbi:MAG: 2-C-methyl-D-erythritol 4-phosphate cytidylyltransferase [Endomicrobium sp.]|jgi:2-C-methyl-D-erythritol 4-phosphate cytidylyltransferase|nr:2-C-methyl-D-erythritol 4-phosphate cytidylyltransferase [Endomicrobium sp.]